MIWDILVRKLEEAGLGVAGADIFINSMPAETEVGIMIKPPLVGIRVNHYIPGYYTPVVQLIVRHTDPVIGEKMANDVVSALRILNESFDATSERGAVNIKMFLPRELPIRFPNLQGGGYEFSLNFITAFGIAAL